MSKPEIAKKFTEYCLSGFNPIPSENISFQLNPDLQKNPELQTQSLIDTIVTKLRENHLYQNSNWKKYENLKGWIEIEEKEIIDTTKNFFETNLKYIFDIFHSRQLKQIELKIHDGFFSPKKLIDFSINYHENLGDGTAYYSNNQWNLTQRKGNYESKYQLRLIKETIK